MKAVLRFTWMKQITLRNVDPTLAKALDEEKRRRAQSLNATVLDLLRRALGLSAGQSYSNGLAELSGTWTDEDLRQFEADTEDFGQIDDGLRK